MKIIADSGATKTQWELIDTAQKVRSILTKGINPYYQKTAEIDQILREELQTQLPAIPIKNIHYYGAGCSVPENKSRIQQAFERVFPNVELEIEHDLLATARALCGREAGIACILGTGSNACLYDGQKIISENLNLGFILGDEGSGSQMGKKLIVAFLQKEMPMELAEKFYQKYPIDRAIVLENIYQKNTPSRYLASFTPFLQRYLDHPFCYQIVYESFQEFVQKYVLKLQHSRAFPIHFSGSIAYHYAEILKTVLEDEQLILGKILKTPMEGLLAYHLSD